MPQLLSYGTTGADVRELQGMLNAKPPSNLPPLAVDGIFGPRTQARVKEFQQNKGLQVDGIVGPVTWGALKAGGDEPNGDLEEFRSLCDYSVFLLRHELKANSNATLKGVNFFRQCQVRIERLAFPASPVTGNAIGVAAGPPVMAVAVGLVVVVALVLFAFTLACMIVVASLQKPPKQLEIDELRRKFEQTMQQIEHEVGTAPIKITIMLILMKSAVEHAIEARINELKEQMERCRQKNPLAELERCRKLFEKILVQMLHLLKQAQLTRIGSFESLGPILLGLGRSFEFLIELITAWAHCVKCPALQLL